MNSKEIPRQIISLTTLPHMFTSDFLFGIHAAMGCSQKNLKLVWWNLCLGS